MSEQQVQQEQPGAAVIQQGQAGTKKKKASWLRTVLWVISMMLLVNIVMAIIAYFLFFHNQPQGTAGRVVTQMSAPFRPAG